MSLDSAVPAEGIEEKSTVVKSVDKETAQQKAVKGNLGELAKNPEIERNNQPDVEPGKMLEDEKFTQK